MWNIAVSVRNACSAIIVFRMNARCADCLYVDARWLLYICRISIFISVFDGISRSRDAEVEYLMALRYVPEVEGLLSADVFRF